MTRAALPETVKGRGSRPKLWVGGCWSKVLNFLSENLLQCYYGLAIKLSILVCHETLPEAQRTHGIGSLT